MKCECGVGKCDVCVGLGNVVCAWRGEMWCVCSVGKCDVCVAWRNVMCV